MIEGILHGYLPTFRGKDVCIQLVPVVSRDAGRESLVAPVYLLVKEKATVTLNGKNLQGTERIVGFHIDRKQVRVIHGFLYQQFVLVPGKGATNAKHRFSPA